MHLRVFGYKCYVHNNGKESLGKFDPMSDEAIVSGYSSHSKAYKVFNKRALCVEESVHVFFDETNSVVEHDTQDEEFKLGLVRKDLSLTQSSIVDKGKTPEGEPSPGIDNLEGGQGANQSGRSIAKPEQNRPTQPNYSRTDMGTSTGTVPKLVSPSIKRDW